MTDENTDRAQIARMGQEWEHDGQEWRALEDAPTAPIWLTVALGIGAVCVAVAIIAALWGRV